MPCRNSVAKTTCLNKSLDSNAPIPRETCTHPAHTSLVRDMHASMEVSNMRPSCATQTGVHMHHIQASAISHILQLLWTSQKMCLHLATTHPEACYTLDACISC